MSLYRQELVTKIIVNDIIRQDHIGFLDKVEKKVRRSGGARASIQDLYIVKDNKVRTHSESEGLVCVEDIILLLNKVMNSERL